MFYNSDAQFSRQRKQAGVPAASAPHVALPHASLQRTSSAEPRDQSPRAHRPNVPSASRSPLSLGEAGRVHRERSGGRHSGSAPGEGAATSLGKHLTGFPLAPQSQAAQGGIKSSAGESVILPLDWGFRRRAGGGYPKRCTGEGAPSPPGGRVLRGWRGR